MKPTYYLIIWLNLVCCIACYITLICKLNSKFFYCLSLKKQTDRFPRFSIMQYSRVGLLPCKNKQTNKNENKKQSKKKKQNKTKQKKKKQQQQPNKQTNEFTVETYAWITLRWLTYVYARIFASHVFFYQTWYKDKGNNAHITWLKLAWENEDGALKRIATHELWIREKVYKQR